MSFPLHIFHCCQRHSSPKSILLVGGDLNFVGLEMKIENFIVGLFAAIFLLQNGVSGFNEQRIQGGTATPAGMFEFLPLLRLMLQGPGIDKIRSGICSSTIISPRHILTAAHCFVVGLDNGLNGTKLYRVPSVLVDYRPREKIDVLEQKGEMEKVQLRLQNFSIQPRIIFHPSYFGENRIYDVHHTSTKPFNDDIAIIEFPEGTNLGITPITLVSNYVEKKGDTAIASGYGNYNYTVDPATQEVKPLKPETLLNATVPVYLTQECELFHAPTLICTGSLGLRSDKGDSGGPLMVERNGKYYQIGVTSVGAFNTSMYIRISNYCDWISKTTKGAAKCELLPDENSPSPNGPDEPGNPSPLQPDPSAPAGSVEPIFKMNIYFSLFYSFIFTGVMLFFA